MSNWPSELPKHQHPQILALPPTMPPSQDNQLLWQSAVDSENEKMTWKQKPQ
jgi:hypothetical protein